MGKSTISMAIFHCYVSSPEGNHGGAERGIRLGLQRRVGLLGVPQGAADADDEQKAGLSGPRL